MSKGRAADLIVLDLDNTLFDETRIVSQGNRAAIKKAQDAGAVVSICTARMHPAALFEAAKAGIDAPLAVCNGGYIYHRGKISHKRCMSAGQMEALCNILDPLNVPYYVSTAESAVTNDYTVCGAYYTYWHVDDTGFDALPLVTYRTARRIVPAVGGEGLRLTVISEDPEVLRVVDGKLRAVEGVDVFTSWCNNVEVMAPGGKGAAIASLCDLLGIDPSRAMAIGDSDSDISMLQAVGHPVAVENATDALKAAARYVVPDCRSDGVAYAIENIALAGGDA